MAHYQLLYVFWKFSYVYWITVQTCNTCSFFNVLVLMLVTNLITVYSSSWALYIKLNKAFYTSLKFVSSVHLILKVDSIYGSLCMWTVSDSCQLVMSSIVTYPSIFLRNISKHKILFYRFWLGLPSRCFGWPPYNWDWKECKSFLFFDKYKV